MSAAITLTDSPEVVALKREFRQLDAREQELKPTSRAGQITAANATLLQAVRDRKAEIARQLFGQPVRESFEQVGLRSN